MNQPGSVKDHIGSVLSFGFEYTIRSEWDNCLNYDLYDFW